MRAETADDFDRRGERRDISAGPVGGETFLVVDETRWKKNRRAAFAQHLLD
jgi:hypothetical protein